MEIERRTLTGVEVRAAVDGAAAKLVGYASRFNTPYEVCGFTEIVAPGAFNRAISEGQDVRALINHDANFPLGRTGPAGNLALAIDAEGLRVELTPLDTQLWRDTLVNVAAGVYSQMSIGFMTREDDWSTKDGQAHREIRDVDLLDVSVVAYPASPTTSVSVRALEQRDAHSTVEKRVPPSIDESTIAMVKSRLAAIEVAADQIDVHVDAIEELLGISDEADEPEADPAPAQYPNPSLPGVSMGAPPSEGASSDAEIEIAAQIRENLQRLSES